MLLSIVPVMYGVVCARAWFCAARIGPLNIKKGVNA